MGTYGREAREALSCFLERLAMGDDASGITCCYGKEQTVAALNLGAVEVLLISAEHEDVDDLTKLANSHGTPVHQVDDSTAQGSQFCNSYVMGGWLRWPLDPESLDMEENNHDQCNDT